MEGDQQRTKEKNKTPRMTCCTFSLSPENEGPEGGGDLEPVVAVSSHLFDGAGQDHTFGVHLLKRERETQEQMRALQNPGSKHERTPLPAC